MRLIFYQDAFIELIFLINVRWDLTGLEPLVSQLGAEDRTLGTGCHLQKRAKAGKSAIDLVYINGCPYAGSS
jgi:hypothetical protein